MIRFLIIAFCLSISMTLCAQGQSRDIYTVRGIAVDERAPTVQEAQQIAFATAKVIGARQLVERLTRFEDRAAASDFIIDSAMAEMLAAAVDVEEEIAGAGRYRGRLAVVFNPTNVRNALKQADLPFTDRTGPKAVLFTSTANGMGLAWNMAWEDTPRGRFIPLETSRTAGFGTESEWDVLQDEVALYGAQRAVLAELKGAEGAYRVTVLSVTPSGTRTVGTTRRAATIEDAVSAVGDLLDQDWKETAIVVSNTRTLIEATVLYTSLAEWNTLRQALVRSPLVSNVQTRAISTDGAVVGFAFAGDGQRLTSDLRDRGVVINMEPMGWVMTSARTAGQQ